MKKRVLTVLLASALAVTSLAACGSDPTANNAGGDSQVADGGSTDAGEQTIGISMPTKSLERWNRDGDYLDQQFQAAGYKTEVTYSDNDSAKQVNDIQNLIADGCDILIVAAIDGEALNTVMDQAAEANIPVISYDRLIKNDAVSYYVSFDNYTVGTLQGQFVEEQLGLADAADGTSYNIEFTAGDPADNNAGYFFQGAIDVLQPYIDSGVLNVVSGQTDFDSVATDQWNTDTAMDRAENILGSYYSDGTQLDAWVCSNDSTALGVAKALDADYAGSNDILVTGQDGDIENLKNIVDGKQTMTVYKNVQNEAVVTLALAQKILNGETVDDSICGEFSDFESTYDTTSYFTSDGNYVDSILLVPDVITADSLQKLVDTGLYAWDANNQYLESTAE